MSKLWCKKWAWDLPSNEIKIKYRLRNYIVLTSTFFYISERKIIWNRSLETWWTNFFSLYSLSPSPSPPRLVSLHKSICGFTINIVLYIVFTRPLHAALRRLSSEHWIMFFKRFYHAHVNHNTLFVCDRKPQRLFTIVGDGSACGRKIKLKIMSVEFR